MNFASSTDARSSGDLLFGAPGTTLPVPVVTFGRNAAVAPALAGRARAEGPAANAVVDLRRVLVVAAGRGAPEEAAALAARKAVVRVCDGAGAGMRDTEGVDLDAEGRSEDTVAGRGGGCARAEAVRAAIARGGCAEGFTVAVGGLLWAGLVAKGASSSATNI